jgi:hypothetical protein
MLSRSGERTELERLGSRQSPLESSFENPLSCSYGANHLLSALCDEQDVLPEKLYPLTLDR